MISPYTSSIPKQAKGHPGSCKGGDMTAITYCFNVMGGDALHLGSLQHRGRKVYGEMGCTQRRLGLQGQQWLHYRLDTKERL